MCGAAPGAAADSPVSQGESGVTEEGQLLLQTTHTERQVARRQDEEDDPDERGGHTSK